MWVSFFNDEVNYICMDYIVFFDLLFFDNVIDRVFEFSICSFVGLVFVINYMFLLEFVYYDVILFFDFIVWFFEEFCDGYWVV